MAIPNYGLISGLADGLHQGLLDYQVLQNSKRNQKRDDFLAGLQQDDQGNYQYNPTKQAQLDMANKIGALQGQQQLDKYDKTSAYSQGQRGLGKILLDKAIPGAGSAITDDMSGAQINDENGLIGKGISGGFGMQGQQAKAASIASSSGARNDSYADRDTTAVSSKYEDTLKPYKNVNEDIAKIESTLNTKDKNGKPLITAQQIGDANAAIARIYSPNHMSDSTVARTEYESIPAKFAAALQKLSANPQDSNSRALVEHIIDQAHHIGNVSNDNALKELDSLDSGFNNLQVESAKKTAQDKSKFFKNRFGKKYEERGQGLLNNSANSNSTMPKEGDTKEYQGALYKVINGHWVKQNG